MDRRGSTAATAKAELPAAVPGITPRSICAPPTSFQPSVVVVDPVTNLLMASTLNEVRSMLTRLVDFLKTRGITAIFTSLTAAGGSLEASEANVSSLMDTRLLLKSIEVGDRKNRALYVLKSRGM